MVEISYEKHKRGILLGICCIIEGLIAVFSLGFYYRQVSLDFLSWWTRREIKKGVNIESK